MRARNSGSEFPVIPVEVEESHVPRVCSSAEVESIGKW